MADRGDMGGSRGASDTGDYGNSGRGERGNGYRLLTAKEKAPYGRDHTGRPVSKAERDAWNAQKRSTGLSSAALFQSLTNPQVDPFAQMMEMFASGSGAHSPHSPSGPDQAAVDQQAADDFITGQNDLKSLYGDYINASETATKYINNQINSERSNSALLGIDYSITDEDKSSRISNYFSEIWSEDNATKLTDLNTKFGDEENPLEFLISRGVADEAAKADEAPSSGKPRGSTILSAFDNEDDKLSGNSILGGG